MESEILCAKATGVGVEGVDAELDRLVRQYQHRVRYFANRVQQRFAMGTRWSDELVSAGYWGLFNALRNRREGAHERELSAYVSRRVQGAVIDAARVCLTQAAHAEPSVGGELHGLESPSGFSDDDVARRSRRPSSMSRQTLDAGPEECEAHRWRLSAIDEALSALEPDQRAVLRAYMAGDSVTEIARDHGVSPGTMQVRFNKMGRIVRARSPRLRRILLDHEMA